MYLGKKIENIQNQDNIYKQHEFILRYFLDSIMLYSKLIRNYNQIIKMKDNDARLCKYSKSKVWFFFIKKENRN
jgi:hypothetical protein